MTAVLAGSPSSPATPDIGFPLPQQRRLLAYAWVLSAEIGPRPAGSPGEARAADYLRARRESFGYDVTLQAVPFSSETYRTASFSVFPDEAAIPAVAVAGAGVGEVTAPLVAAGSGAPGDIDSTALAGAIAFVRSSDSPLSPIAARIRAAGGRALVFASSAPGRFNAVLEPPVDLPVVAIGRSDGDDLLGRLHRGPLSARIEVGGSEGTGANVIARPPGRSCETVVGGHFDSVPQSRGASDNASGTAVVLELARVVAAARIPGNSCFVFFTAEEFGLFGSRAYLQSLRPEERSRLQLMVNFDMSGVGDRWVLIGSPDAVAMAEDAAASAGVAAEPGEMPGRTSDFASFLADGVPAVLVFDSDDPLLHTPEDTFDRLQPRDLEEAACIGLALLRRATSQISEGSPRLP